MDQQAFKSYVTLACEINQITLNEDQIDRVVVHLTRTEQIAQKLNDYQFLDDDELVEIYKLKI